MVGVVHYENKITKVPGVMEIDAWDKLGPQWARVFVLVERVPEPPEVTELKNRLKKEIKR